MTAVRTCRSCGCTDARACVTDRGPCWWVPGAGDLCSACDPLSNLLNPQAPARVTSTPTVPVRQPRAGKPRIDIARVLGCHPGPTHRERPGAAPAADLVAEGREASRQIKGGTYFWPVGEASALAVLPRLTVQQTRPHQSGADPRPRAEHRADSVRDRGVGVHRRGRARPCVLGRGGP